MSVNLPLTSPLLLPLVHCIWTKTASPFQNSPPLRLVRYSLHPQPHPPNHFHRHSHRHSHNHRHLSPCNHSHARKTSNSSPPYTITFNLHQQHFRIPQHFIPSRQPIHLNKLNTLHLPLCQLLQRPRQSSQSRHSLLAHPLNLLIYHFNLCNHTTHPHHPLPLRHTALMAL